MTDIKFIGAIYRQENQLCIYIRNGSYKTYQVNNILNPHETRLHRANAQT